MASAEAALKVASELAAAGKKEIDKEEEQLGATLEPVSLTNSDHSENATSTSTDSDYGDSNDESPPPEPIKCSAVHMLERDIPDFDYSHLVLELRKLILEHAKDNPGLYSASDVEKCAKDEWHLSRFLLRHKLDLQAAFEMLKAAMRFNHESLANHLKPEDFPAEFYEVGGLVPFGVDRKGNRMLYMLVRRHKKTPEITSILQAFIYFNIKRLDEEAEGKGISIVIDCSGAGLANADMDTLFFVISTLKNYFPKGLSYFLVHEIPWILKPLWHIAKGWVPEEHRQLVKFSDASSIFEYIDRDNLPELLGGAGQLNICAPPNCTRLEEAAKLWGVDGRTCMRVINKFRDDLPKETVERIETHFRLQEEEENGAAEAAANG